MDRNKRQIKKLCKNAAEFLAKDYGIDCIVDDGIYYAVLPGIDDFDTFEAFDFMVDCYEAHFTNYEEDKAPEFIGLPSTPKNVFAWARNEVVIGGQR